MADKSNIEWTDATWNPIRGCSRVSEGCRHCYAEAVAARFSGPGLPYEGLAVRKSDGPHWTGEIEFVNEHLADPLRWKRPRRIFVNSMSDLFHSGVSDYDLYKIFAVMGLADWHTFQCLTKRPERQMEFMNRPGTGAELVASMARESFEEWTLKGRSGSLPRQASIRREANMERGESLVQIKPPKLPFPNVWLGTSAEDQGTYNERSEFLAGTRAALRWLSLEPLLGPIILGTKLCCFDWVVVGGESGPGARPCQLSWIRSIVKECITAHVPVFVKQIGADPRLGPLPWTAKLRDRKGGDMAEWPSDLRVREYPNVRV